MTEKNIKVKRWVEGKYKIVTMNDKILSKSEIIDLLAEYMVENKELKQENKQLIKELFESEEEYLLATYSDNPVRRDDKIQELKHEFKERFGDRYD